MKKYTDNQIWVACKEVMIILENKPSKYFSSLKLGKKTGLEKVLVYLCMSYLIRKRVVKQKFIYNKRKKFCLRLIKKK